MARLSAHPEAFAHMLYGGGLLAYCPDGVTLIKRPSWVMPTTPVVTTILTPATKGVVGITNRGHGWKVYRRKKPEVPLTEWRSSREAKLANYRKVQPWRFATTRLPTMRTMEKWLYDGTCKTPTGYTVEPDGEGPDGSPSWIRFFGLI